MKKTLSLIVPYYNEETNLQNVIRRLTQVLESLPLNWEILLVDNCSTDRSYEIASSAAESEKRIKVIRFSRNFGPNVEASMAAGFEKCKGDAAIVVYSDLQDPPELIPRFVEAWEAGADVFYGVQTSRPGDPKWRNFLVNRFYASLERISDTPIHTKSGDFKLISRRVINILNEMPERARFSRGLISWIGFDSVPVFYSREPRASGKSKSNFWAISYTALTGITSFSLKPLRILTALGFGLMFFSILGIITVTAQWVTSQTLPGLPSVMVLLLMFLGINMGTLGLIGEYLGRIQLEVKARPLFVIKDELNI